MEYLKHPERKFMFILSVPVIYSMALPLAVFDVFLEIYHHICFALYGIPYVKRSKYIKVDRQKLRYLQFRQKINCAYCGYANGLLSYGSEIAKETERFWCGIQHQDSEGFLHPEHHKDFLPYNDEKAYQECVDCDRTKQS